jgi:hypothetical protein
MALLPDWTLYSFLESPKCSWIRMAIANFSSNTSLFFVRCESGLWVVLPPTHWCRNERKKRPISKTPRNNGSWDFQNCVRCELSFIVMRFSELGLLNTASKLIYTSLKLHLLLTILTRMYMMNYARKFCMFFVSVWRHKSHLVVASWTAIGYPAVTRWYVMSWAWYFAYEYPSS